MNQTLYEKVGGEEGIAKVFDHLYSELVYKDEKINQFFKHTDMEIQRQHQTKFISYILGGPNDYSGASMKEVHEGMNIQPEHFSTVVQHLQNTLAYFGIDEAEITQAIDKIRKLKDDIINK